MPNPRNPKNWCLSCGTFCAGSRSSFCLKCYWGEPGAALRAEKAYESSKRKRDFLAVNARHRYQGIRNHGHVVMRLLGPKDPKCAICGYSTHVELAHLRPLSDFPEDATLREMNDLSNLAWLCPNHHWEQEQGLVVL